MGLCSLCHRLVVGTESIHERPGLRIQEAQCRAQRRGKKKKNEAQRRAWQDAMLVGTLSDFPPRPPGRTSETSQQGGCSW